MRNQIIFSNLKEKITKNITIHNFRKFIEFVNLCSNVLTIITFILNIFNYIEITKNMLPLPILFLMTFILLRIIPISIKTIIQILKKRDPFEIEEIDDLKEVIDEKLTIRNSSRNYPIENKV